jgi:hypothetical protein
MPFKKQVTSIYHSAPGEPARLPAHSSKVGLISPTDDLTSAIPPLSPGSTHSSASVISTLPPPAPSISQLADQEAELLHRLYNLRLPTADITRVVAILNGRGESTVEEAQLLRQLSNLNVPNGDINLIVDAMRRRDQSSGDYRYSDAPPEYDFTRQMGA